MVDIAFKELGSSNILNPSYFAMSAQNQCSFMGKVTLHKVIISGHGKCHFVQLSKPNATPMQPQRNRWVWLENDFANHPKTTTHPHKLNVSNISAFTDQILMKL